MAAQAKKPVEAKKDQKSKYFMKFRRCKKRFEKR